MTQTQKVIRGKVGVLELAKQLGNVSQACRMMGYSRETPSLGRGYTTLTKSKSYPMTRSTKFSASSCPTRPRDCRLVGNRSFEPLANQALMPWKS